jgi:hypothetical protein
MYVFANFVFYSDSICLICIINLYVTENVCFFYSPVPILDHVKFLRFYSFLRTIDFSSKQELQNRERDSFVIVPEGKNYQVFKKCKKES